MIMMKNLLCKIGLHRWQKNWRPSRCSYYPFDILVNKTCKNCGKIVVPEEKKRNDNE